MEDWRRVRKGNDVRNDAGLTRRRMDTIAELKAVYAEWERGNYSAGLELYDPEVHLEVHNPIPDAGAYEGLARLQDYMRRFLETWQEYEIHGIGFEAAGDQVVVQVHHKGSASGVTVEMDYDTVWTFRDGRVVRVDIGRDRAGLNGD